MDNNVFRALDPASIRVTVGKGYICVSDGLDFVLHTMHMMLQYRSKTYRLQHGTGTVHPAFVQCIVQGLPPKKSPGDTVQPGVAQAVLPTMRTQLANPDSVVLHV